MNVQAEVSLYPLRTPNLGTSINRFLGELQVDELTIQPGTMSSIVEGEVETVFAKLGKAFRDAAEKEQIVLILKISNACPRGRETVK